MSNRAANQGILDANSQLPTTFTISAPLSSATNTTTVSGVAGVFRGFMVSGQGTGQWSATAYDALSTGTLSTATAIGALTTATTGGVWGFQWAGDVIFNTGLTVVFNTGTVAGVVKVVYL